MISQARVAGEVTSFKKRTLLSKNFGLKLPTSSAEARLNILNAYLGALSHKNL
jgi:hypothetical protein